jgi:hypothetical protein
MQKLIKICPKGMREFKAVIATPGYRYMPANIELYLNDTFTDRDFAKAYSDIAAEALVFYKGYEDFTVDNISVIIRNVLRAYNKETNTRTFTAHGYKKLADKLITMDSFEITTKGPDVIWEYMNNKLQERGLY